MKKFLILLLLVVSCGKLTEQKDPLQPVKDFLKWYGDHYKEATAFGLVNQADSINYSVNFEETEKFLAYLKSSGFFSDKYLDEFRKQFEEAQRTFEKDSINEGPPPGFDYDIVLWTQEPELVFRRASDPPVIFSEVNENTAIIELDLVTNLRFELSKGDGGWKIDRIIPTPGD